MPPTTDQNSSSSIKIIAALIGAAATVLVGYWQFGRAKPDNPSINRMITGRVVDAVNDHALGHAKVMLEAEGLPPVQYTDSNGIFTFPLPPSAPYVRLKVEMPGYESDDRRIDLRPSRKVRRSACSRQRRRHRRRQPVPPPNDAEVSREFMLGRWQVEQAAGQASAGTVMDYQADGTLTGSATQFINGFGQRQNLSGRWDYEKLSKSTFRLELRRNNQPPWLGTFKIIDHNHIHNIDQNYIAVRVE